MSRITQIEITNLLAFHGSHKVNTEGKSLLIYGENGSGKSSLYRALDTFFNAADRPNALAEYRNRWALPTDGNSDIILSFEGQPTPVSYLQAQSEPWINDVYLSSGFLSYREMLRTHFDLDEDPNYFDLVINHILKGYKSATGKVLSQDWKDIEDACQAFLDEDWGEPDQIIQTENTIDGTENEDINEEDETITSRQLKEKRIRELENLVDDFNEALDSFLQKLNEKIQDFLKEFDNKIILNLEIRQAKDRYGVDLTWDDESPYKGADFDYKEGDRELRQALTQPFITAKVTLFNQSFPKYQSFLNEARLSALAICIFLGATHSKPNQNGTKILFLDDILIGLDTGNRLALLILLKKYFSEYQVFLTTYDKGWFDIVKNQLSYVSVEMYYEPIKQIRQSSEAFVEFPNHQEFPNGLPDSDKRYFERPLIKNHKGNLEQADFYFRAMDFPAAGNVLRKECERILKSYLPDTRRIAKDGSEITTLEALLSQLELFFQDCEIELPLNLASSLRFFSRAILNPASHDDLKSPLYRKEIEKLFEFMEHLKQLPAIERKLVLEANQELIYENQALKYKAKIILADNLYKVVCNGKIQHSECRYYMDWWEWNGVEYAKNAKGEKLSIAQISNTTQQPRNSESVISGIVMSLGLETVPNFLKEFKTNEATLEELLS